MKRDLNDTLGLIHEIFRDKSYKYFQKTPNLFRIQLLARKTQVRSLNRSFVWCLVISITVQRDIAQHLTISKINYSSTVHLPTKFPKNLLYLPMDFF